MDENLISKKELMELAGISYGQLYRWKRKNLIPEEWFIRKSTFTGQETFFPKREILARVQRIINMKEDLSLDKLADMFSSTPLNIQLPMSQVTKQNIVSEPVLKLFADKHRDASSMSFQDLLAVYIADIALQTGHVSLDEGEVIIETIRDYVEKFQGKQCELVFIRKLGVGTCLLVQSPVELHCDSGSHVVVRLPIADCIEQLKAAVS